MLASLIIVIIVIVTEGLFAWAEIRGQKKAEDKGDRRWRALFARFGIDDPIEDGKSRKNKAKKQRW